MADQTPKMKRIDVRGSNARLWASKLYRQHGSGALEVLDDTVRRTKPTGIHRTTLDATRSELVRIIGDAAAIETHKATLSPFRRFIFWLSYKRPGS